MSLTAKNIEKLLILGTLTQNFLQTLFFGTVQQCEKWSDLMPLITWQLWLVRELVAEHRLPWQKPQKVS